MEVRTPGGKTIQFDPLIGNPKIPQAAADLRACDLLLITHGHEDHSGDAPIASRLL